MVKASLIAMAMLTVLVAIGLRWREERMAATGRRQRADIITHGKRTVNRWVTAAAIATISTMLIMGGLHYLRLHLG